jgi:pentatricopeptide repeat protein
VPRPSLEEVADKRTNIRGNAWEDISGLYGASLESAQESKETLPGHSREGFRKKYQEIWGIDKMQQSEAGEVEAEKSGNREEVPMKIGDQHQEVLPTTDSFRESKLKSGRRRVLGATNFRRARHIPPVRSKFVRWTPGMPPTDMFVWQRRFAALNLRLESFMNGRKMPRLVDITKYKTTKDFRDFLMGNDPSESLRSVWEGVPAEERIQIWPEVMLSSLRDHPTKALEFLAATYTNPYPPGYAVSDSLDYIVSYYLRERTIQNPKNALEIFSTFERMLRLGPRGHFHLSQNSVYLLLKHLTDIHIGALFQLLTEFNHPLHKNTLMHFPSELQKSRGADERMEILRKLWQEGSDFNSPEVLSVCTTLLQRKKQSSGTTYSDSEIFEFMLECGMKPNIVIYNVLLQNSLEAGDPQTAWQIHDMMAENGIETDAYTYSMLLCDAKWRGDRASIERTVNIVTAKGMRNAHITTDVLHSIFLLPHLEQERQPSKKFERMLSVYCQYFRLEPLADIIPWFKDAYANVIGSVELDGSETASISNEARMVAAVPTLVIMLTALLRQLDQPGLVLRFYNHFCDRLKAGDPTAKALAQSTHVYNIILLALGRFSETLALCPRLIGDMLSSNIAATSETAQTTPFDDQNENISQVNRPVSDDLASQTIPALKPTLPEVPTGPISMDSSDTVVQTASISAGLSSSSEQRLHPKPDIYTWSILLKIFMDHRQPRAAEKVLTMMKERKVWPNQITWNSLIIGYARMQDMTMTVNTVNRLEKGGFDLDAVSMKGLAYFQNRRALIEAMRDAEAKNPGASLKKRSAVAGKAKAALYQTLRMVRDGLKGDGLQPETEERSDGGREHRGYDTVIPAGHIEGDEESIVRDMPLLENSAISPVEDSEPDCIR